MDLKLFSSNHKKIFHWIIFLFNRFNCPIHNSHFVIGFTEMWIHSCICLSVQFFSLALFFWIITHQYLPLYSIERDRAWQNHIKMLFISFSVSFSTFFISNFFSKSTNDCNSVTFLLFGCCAVLWWQKAICMKNEKQNINVVILYTQIPCTNVHQYNITISVQ